MLDAAAVGVTVSLVTPPVEVTDAAEDIWLELAEDDAIVGWTLSTAEVPVKGTPVPTGCGRLSRLDEVCTKALELELVGAVGKMLIKGKSPVDATSSWVEDSESLVTGTAASGAEEEDVAEVLVDDSSSGVPNKLSKKLGGSDVAGCASDVVDEDVVFCRAFCLLTGRGK